MNDLQRLVKVVPAFVQATGLTLELTLIAILIGLALGLVLALGRISRNVVFNKASFFYIWFFRGTPLLLQLSFIYYSLPMIAPTFSMGRFTAGFIALGLNSGAYLAEIIRAAIQSIDKGQMEAAKALGMTYGQAMRKIIVPQSYRRLIPPVGNEFIALLKDSSLVSIISLTELMRITTTMSNSTGSVIYYIPCAIFYLLLTTLFTYIFSRLEKKYSVYE